TSDSSCGQGIVASVQSSSLESTPTVPSRRPTAKASPSPSTRLPVPSTSTPCSPPQRAALPARQSQDHSPPDQAPPFGESRSVCRRGSCPCCRRERAGEGSV